MEDSNEENLKNLMEDNNYSALENKAMICEVAYFIGKNKEIDDYIQKHIIDEIYGVDEYILFYIFCEFIVNNVEYEDLDDLYEVLKDDYKSVVEKFLEIYAVRGEE